MTDQDAQYRVSYIERINNSIFDLVYYGKFSFEDCENMTSVELKWFHKKLVETKDAENKAKEDAMKQAAEARKAAKNSVQSHKARRKRR